MRVSEQGYLARMSEGHIRTYIQLFIRNQNCSRSSDECALRGVRFNLDFL